jgi:hypothetical protein
MSALRPPVRPFVPLPGNGTSKRSSLPPLTNEELKAEIMAPYVAEASSAADLSFLVAAFVPISFDDAQDYLRHEHDRAIAEATYKFRRSWDGSLPTFENEIANAVAHAFYWRINQLATSPGLGGRA